MRYLLPFCLAGALFAQGTTTKPKAEDYEVHAQAKDAAIGAEFMVHSFSRGEQMFIAKDYLVVEVALYPPKGEAITLQNGNFTLRINGKKDVLVPESSTMAAAALKNPQWEMPTGPRGQVDGTVGNSTVILGAPPSNPSPFPGSQAPGTQLPPRVEVPPYNPAGVEREPVDAGQLLMETALVEGPHHAPTSGFLYFPYRGKISSIKTLELLYEDAVLKLR